MTIQYNDNPVMTEWHNPTKDDMVVRIFVGSGRWQNYPLAAGKSTLIQSDEDLAVQDVHIGTVNGGLAPRLQRVGGPQLRLDSAFMKSAEQSAVDAAALDAERAERQRLEAENASLRAMLEKASAPAA